MTSKSKFGSFKTLQWVWFVATLFVCVRLATLIIHIAFEYKIQDHLESYAATHPGLVYHNKNVVTGFSFPILICLAYLIIAIIGHVFIINSKKTNRVRSVFFMVVMILSIIFTAIYIIYVLMTKPGQHDEFSNIKNAAYRKELNDWLKGLHLPIIVYIDLASLALLTIFSGISFGAAKAYKNNIENAMIQ